MYDLFAGYRQYINYRIEPKENGKTNKIPIDPHNLLTYEEAAPRGPVGFMFTEGDPFFFVDIDSAWTSTGWSPLAENICSLFKGCAIEVSQSGQGLHIFGSGVPAVPHSNKNSELNIEFYTEGRFAALTGTHLTGTPFFQPDAQIFNGFLTQYFPPRPSAEAAMWASEPVPEWNGPTDDDELLKIALRSKSAAATFGTGISFRELFEADPAALERRFPSPNGGFDWSSADLALLSHLAFYTGKNCERMRRIFERSPLSQREKWQNREDYRERSILNAVSGCRNVYSKKPKSEIVAPGRAGLQLLNLEGQLELFKGCVYVINPHRIFVPKRGLLRPEQFKAVFGGYQFLIAQEGKPSRNAFEAFTESQLYDFPIADDVCFRPEQPAGAIVSEESRQLINTYEPINIEILDADVSPFLDLISKLLPASSDREILLSYMAACVQFPGVKFQWAPLIQGVEGNGKTFLATAMSKAIGRRYTHLPKASDLGGNGMKFNGWLYGKLFVGVEELTVADLGERQNILNAWITNDVIEYQFKGGHQFNGDNRANFMFFCNPKDCLRITENSRRYCPFYTAQQEVSDLKRCGMDGLYFPRLYDWAKNRGGWAAIAGYLRRYPVNERYNPAGNCQRAPETSSTAEARFASMTPIEQEIAEAVAQDQIGFRGGWVSSVALDRLLAEKKLRLALNKRKAALEAIGYAAKERLNNCSAVDGGKKPILYIHKSRVDLFALPAGAETAAAYLKAQGSF